MENDLDKARLAAKYSSDGDLIRSLIAEIESMKRVAAVDKSFYDLAVRERDYANLQVGTLRTHNAELIDKLLEASRAGLDVDVEAAKIT